MHHLIVSADGTGHRIDRNIYGHFIEHLGRCVDEGIWVGQESPIPNTRGMRDDVIQALRRLKIPVLRWPGGCFADEYHWRDGVGPRAERPSMVNTHWGGVTETNAFGTHEFLDFCALIGAQPYICGNVGSGAVREMQEWVEYITHDGRSPMADLRRRNGRDAPWALPYFGVGNENWGCGGSMRPEYYADLYRRYATYVRNFGANKVFKIACGANSDDYRWTEVLMREAAAHMDGLSLHYYTVPGPSWEAKGSATQFGEEEWAATLAKCLRMDELITRHGTIMDRYDPQKRVALIVDEWGTWYDVEPGTNPGFLYQQNTLRDALVAGLTLNVLNSHCDRVRMANIAQTVNVLQAMALADGPRMVTTPTYHVFEMYAPHHDATLLPTLVQGDSYEADGYTLAQVSASASRGGGGRIHLTLCNTDPHHEADTLCTLHGVVAQSVAGRALTASAMNARNTFDQPNQVTPQEFTGITITAAGPRLTLPPMSVVALSVHVADPVV